MHFRDLVEELVDAAAEILVDTVKTRLREHATGDSASTAPFDYDWL